MKRRVTRVLVVDDSDVVRRLVTAVVDNDPDLEVVGTAGDGRQALELVGPFQPDVVVLDLDMPVMNGLDTFPFLRARHPEVRVVVLSNIEPPPASAMARAVSSGEITLVHKPLGVAELKETEYQIHDLCDFAYYTPRSA